MKYTIAVLVAVLGAGVIFAGETPAEMEPLGALQLAEDEIAYSVEGGEADVNGPLIRRFAVGQNGVTASYHNKSQDRMRPRYAIELYNRHGFLLGEDTTGEAGFSFGGPGYIDPGDVASEDLRIKWYPLDRIFAKSAVRLPADWKTVKWIVIKNNDPRRIAKERP